MKKPTDDSLTKLADAAFLQAAHKVIKRERLRHAGDHLERWTDEESRPTKGTTRTNEEEEERPGPMTVQELKSQRSLTATNGVPRRV